MKGRGDYANQTRRTHGRARCPGAAGHGQPGEVGWVADG